MKGEIQKNTKQIIKTQSRTSGINTGKNPCRIAQIKEKEMKPKKIIIPNEKVQEYLGSMFYGLEKDLYETENYREEICEYCMGTGVVKADNRYGLSEERGVPGVSMFPYRHESVSFCPHCYNGVAKRCKLCGEIMPKNMLKHNCAQQRAIDDEEEKRKERELLETLEEATEKQLENCKMFYSDYYPYNDGYFEDFYEFFDAWEGEHEEGDPRPEYCYGTDEIEFHIDADTIVYNACEDMYEDAYENAGDIDELQRLIDIWCERNSPGSAYAVHKRFKVRIPWEEESSDSSEEEKKSCADCLFGGRPPYKSPCSECGSDRGKWEPKK